MKAIMISIKPKWVAKILNGEKTIEVRKTMPKCDLPIDVYIYCTKNKPYIAQIPNGYFITNNPNRVSILDTLNGKVVAKFTLNKVEEIEIVYSQENEFGGYSESYGTKTLSTNELLNKSQLDYFELAKYLKDYTPFGYAWHIDNLEIFDEPKELSEFKGCSIGWNNCTPHNCKECPCSKSLTKAPQSYCYVEVL